jgi:hypothetical protein
MNKSRKFLISDPAEMIGTEFPDSINGTFYNACNKTKTRYNHFEDFHTTKSAMD